MIRHYLGQDLESLNMKEIQSLEQQLDSALKNIRSRKVLFFYLILYYILHVIVYFNLT